MWRGIGDQTGSAAPRLGDMIGPFRLVDELGRGGMGVVFKAVREPEGEVCALKILRPEIASDAISLRRFAHESRAAQEVAHPRLVPILDAGEAGGIHYLATRYVPGRTLAGWIKDEGTVPIDDVCRMAADVAAGLDALHERGLIHRDVKPSNVLIDEDGIALLTDFGLSRGRDYTVLTKAGQVMGTLDYLAPELIRGAKATPASDVYALGCTVFEAITGRPPFGDRTTFEVGVAHLEEEPPDPAALRPEVSDRTGWAILQALAKDPKDRPQTATMYSNLLMTAAGAVGGRASR